MFLSMHVILGGKIKPQKGVNWWEIVWSVRVVRHKEHVMKHTKTNGSFVHVGDEDEINTMAFSNT